VDRYESPAPAPEPENDSYQGTGSADMGYPAWTADAKQVAFGELNMRKEPAPKPEVVSYQGTGSAVMRSPAWNGESVEPVVNMREAVPKAAEAGDAGAAEARTEDAQAQEQYEQEITSAERQQNKIIKVVESGDLDILNQPAAQVSEGERLSFYKKVREGEII
jgi:hypothetical protein